MQYIKSIWSIFLAATLRLRLKLLKVQSSPVPLSEPGLIIVQIDGLGHDVLRGAMRRGDAPFLGSLIKQNNYTFSSYFCGVPSITPAVEAELIYGRNEKIPAYSWFHRTLGRFIRGDIAGQVKMLEETMFADVQYPLFTNGSVITGAYSGGATMTNISPDAQAEKNKLLRLARYRILLVPLLNPFRFWRMLLVLIGSTAATLLRATSQKSKEFFWDEFMTLIIKLFMCDLATTIAIIDLWRKTPVLFINYSLVDKVSHTHGIGHPIVFQSIRLIDLYCKKLYDTATNAPRMYRVIILSDHGQSPGIPFETITKETLPALIRRGLGDHGPHVLITYGNDLSLKENTVRDTLFVMPSSSMAHLYFSRWMPVQATKKTIEKCYSALIPTLLSHPGIGWIMVQEEETTHLLARNGDRAEFKDGKVHTVLGKPIDDPEADILLKALARLSQSGNNGDLVLFGGDWHGAWTCFEPYRGTHGGFTGEMVRPFLLTNDTKLTQLLQQKRSMRELFARIRAMRDK